MEITKIRENAYQLTDNGKEVDHIVNIIRISTGEVIDTGIIYNESGSNTGSAPTGGAGSGILARSVSSEADLTTPISDGVYTFYIQEDIALTSDISIADGAKLVYDGGVINANGNEVTFVNNEIGDSKWNFQTGSISTDSSFGYVELILLENFGMIGDYDLETNLGTDNRNCLLELSKIAHTTSCHIHGLRSGNYGYSVVEKTQQLSIPPSNFYLTGSSNLFLDKNVRICALRSDLPDYTIVEVWKGYRNKLYGQGQIYGDLKTHIFDPTGVDPHEYCHAIQASNNSYRTHVQIEATQVSGDLYLNRYTPGFVYLNDIIEDVFTKESYIDEDGSVVSDTDYAYSDRYNIDLDTFKDNGGIVFGGGGFGGLFGLDVQEYRMAFYDDTSIDSDTTTGFMSITKDIQTYRKIRIPEGATSVRLVIYTPSDWTSLRGSIYSPNFCQDTIFEMGYATGGMRQGVTNMHEGGKVINTRFEFNGRSFPDEGELLGHPGSPGYAIDIEDGYQNLQNIEISGNFFRNNKGGDIILKGTQFATITNNTFAYNDYPGYTSVASLSTGNAIYSRVYGNIVQDREIELGRGDDVHSNILHDVTLSLSHERERLRSNYLVRNMRFIEAQGYDTEGVSYINDNTFVYDKPLGETAVFMNCRHTRFENNDFDFGGLLNNTTTKKIGILSAGGQINGWFKNNTVTNLNHSSKSSDYFPLYAYNVSDSNIEGNVSISGGQNDLVEWSNNYINGWVDFQLSGYGSTGDPSDTFKQVNIDNLHVLVDKPGYLSVSNRNLFRILSVDVNMNITNSKFEIKLGGTGLGYNRFLNLLNNGTVVYENCVFTNDADATTTTVDMSQYATCESVTFINCTFENGIEVTLRPEDQNINPTNL